MPLDSIGEPASAELDPRQLTGTRELNEAVRRAIDRLPAAEAEAASVPEAAPVPEPSVKRSWTPLAGDVPSPFNPPPGCKFQNRCPLVEDRCRKGEIELYEVNATHRVRCWKVLGR